MGGWMGGRVDEGRDWMGGLGGWVRDWEVGWADEREGGMIEKKEKKEYK